jgi:hypothetical protein
LVTSARNDICPVIFCKFGRTQILGRYVISERLQFSIATQKKQSTDVSSIIMSRVSATKEP